MTWHKSKKTTCEIKLTLRSSVWLKFQISSQKSRNAVPTSHTPRLFSKVTLLLLSRFNRVRPSTDGSPPGSAVPGILQARTLEWVAISFSNAWKWKVKGKSLICVRLLAAPWTATYQAPPSTGFSKQEYWSRVPLPSPQKCPYFLSFLNTPWRGTATAYF